MSLAGSVARRTIARALVLLVAIGCNGDGDSDTPEIDTGSTGSALTFGTADTIPPSLPLGFLVAPAGIALTPTSLSFAPGGGRLYVASLIGVVLSYPVILDRILGLPSVFLSGLNMPLGVLATDHGVFVSVVRRGKGAVLRARDLNGDGSAESVEEVISGLPIGRHNTNGLAIGPDEMLYVLNGSSSDSGFRSEGGPEEEPPFSGSLLRIDPTATNLTPDASMVVATGWRNPYDIAFVPSGHPSLTPGLAAVTMNGPDGMAYGQPDGSSKSRPTGEDTLSLLDVEDDSVEHFGFPWCLYDRGKGGLAGVRQDAEEGTCDPLPAQASDGLDDPVVRARPVALFGTHVSSDGLAFNPGGNFPEEFDGDLFVAEFGSNPGGPLVGHKIVRVRFGNSGQVIGVEDFMASLLPLDLTFAPDGALWFADLSGLILRVASASKP